MITNSGCRCSTGFGEALTLLGEAGLAAERFVNIRTCENTATSR